MSLRNLLRASSLLVAIAMNACSDDSMGPTHVAQVNLEPSRYSELIARLDLEMKSFGLSKYGAAPGLNELVGRPTLFYVYKTSRSDKRVFLEIADVLKAGTIGVRVYSTDLADEQARKNAISRIDGVLSDFGSKLNVQVAESSEKTDR